MWRFTSYHSLPRIGSATRNYYDIFIDNPADAQAYIEALRASEEEQQLQNITEETSNLQSQQETVITVEEPIPTATSSTTTFITPTRVRTSIPIVDPSDHTVIHYQQPN